MKLIMCATSAAPLEQSSTVSPSAITSASMMFYCELERMKIDGHVRAIVEFDVVPQGENPARVIAVVDLPLAGKARGKPGDSLRMGKIPIDQPIEGGKAAKSKTFAAIIRDTRGRWRVGRGHRDPQGLPERGRRRDGQQEVGGKGGEETSARHGAPQSKPEKASARWEFAFASSLRPSGI